MSSNFKKAASIFYKPKFLSAQIFSKLVAFLCLFGASAIILLGYLYLNKSFDENSISVAFKKESKVDDIENDFKAISNYSFFERKNLVSPDSSLSQLEQTYGSIDSNAIPENPLPYFGVFKISPCKYSPEKFASLQNQLYGYRQVKDVVFNDEFYSMLNKYYYLALVALGLFLISIVITVFVLNYNRSRKFHLACLNSFNGGIRFSGLFFLNWFYELQALLYSFILIAALEYYAFSAVQIEISVNEIIPANIFLALVFGIIQTIISLFISKIKLSLPIKVEVKSRDYAPTGLFIP